MNRRKLGLGILAGVTFAVTGLAGCSSDGGAPEEQGTLRLPLSTQGPSGTTYRLRDATFQIRNQYYYYDSEAGGQGGGGSSPQVITVSSETDPNANAISVSLENGYYYVRLLPGWRMEKVEGGVATDVEATLLSSATQWVYVSAHSTTWVEYQFGIGDRALWFNGNLNLSIQVYEDPDDLYGYSGAAGVPSYGGSP